MPEKTDWLLVALATSGQGMLSPVQVQKTMFIFKQGAETALPAENFYNFVHTITVLSMPTYTVIWIHLRWVALRKFLIDIMGGNADTPLPRQGDPERIQSVMGIFE